MPPTRWLGVSVLTLTFAGHAFAVPFGAPRTLGNPTASTGDYFSGSLAGSATLLAVGAPREDVGAADAGVVHLFDPTSGALLRTLANPTPVAGDQFGAAVAALGSYLLVGTPHANSGAPHSGAAYLMDPATGARIRRFPDPTPDFDDLFGAAVAAAGAYAVVGAPGEGASPEAAGAAYLINPAGGAVLHTLVSPTPGAFDAFGQAVAADGATVVVGAPLADPSSAANAGAAFLFDGNSGALRAPLAPPRVRAGAAFGAAVAAGGGVVAVGAPLDVTGIVAAGAVYLFDATTGAQVRTLTSPNAAPDGRFGASVAIVGDTVLVGAPLEDTDVAADVGRAYLFDAATGALLATFEDPAGAQNDQFGATVAGAGTTVVVGAWFDATGAPAAGAAHVFADLGVLPTTTTTSTTTSTTVTTSTTSTSTSSTTVTATTESTSTTDAVTSTTLTTETTIDSGSSTTVTTTTVTSTTRPPGDCSPTTCTDTDPCTVDACVDGACHHDPALGYAAVTCRLGALDALLHDAAPAALGGWRLTRRLQQKVAASLALLAQAEQASSVGRERLLRRVSRRLAAVTAVTTRAERSGRMQHSVAEQVLQLVSDATAQLAPLHPAT